MKLKFAALTALALVASLFAAPANAATAPSVSATPANAVGLMIQYQPGVSAIAPNGEATGTNFAGVNLTSSHSIGEDLFAVGFDRRLTSVQANEIANRVKLDPRVAAVYVDHDLGVSPQALAQGQLAVLLGTVLKPAVAPTSVKVVDALAVSSPNSPRVKLSWIAPKQLFGAKLAGFQIWRSINGAAFTLAATVSNPKVTYSVQSLGLQAGRLTKFYVRAITKAGIAIKIGAKSATVSITPTARPLAPVISGYSDDYAYAPMWNTQTLAERGGLAVSYEVKASATGLPTLTCTSTTTTCTLTNLDDNANYTISVVATNARGSSSSTNAVRSKEPYYYEQWYLFGKNGVNAPGAWAQLPATYGSDVVVAVIDSGFTAHPDLDSQVVPGYDFVSLSIGPNDGDGWDADASDPGSYAQNNPSSTSTWHGTHVAGLIGAPNNGVGVSGIAPGVKLQSVRALGSNGGQESDLIAAVTWASGGSVGGVPANPTPAKVINISMGTTTVTPCGSALTNAYAAAKARGVTIVTAAGNGDTAGNPMEAFGSFPGNCQGSINVAATNASGDIAYYSNVGLGVDIAAPGGDDRVTAGTPADSNGMMISTYNRGVREPGVASYAFDEGTSMAAPLVAGAAALLYVKKPTITPDEVWVALKAGVKPFARGTNCALTAGTSSQLCGAGILDIGKSLSLVK